MPVGLIANGLSDNPPEFVDRWFLTFVGRGGVLGSPDLGSVQGAAGGGLVSNYRHFFGDVGLRISNSASVYKTISLSDDFGSDYDVTSIPVQNGLAVEFPVDGQILQQRVSVEFAYLDTRVLGDDWAVDWHGEFSASIGTRGNPTRPRWEDLRAGLSYTFGEGGFDQVMMRFGYRF